MTPRHRGDQQGMTLVEVLIGLMIASLLTTMILLTWFALQDSFSYSVTSNVQRDDARQALSRMQREIRDAEARADNGQPALLYADAYSIGVFTTFNKVDNTAVTTEPHLVAYRLYMDGTLWRFCDTSDDGYIDHVAGMENHATAPPDPDRPSNELGEQKAGEGAQKMLGSIVNFSPPARSLPMFKYMYYESPGSLETTSQVVGTDRTNTIAVTSRILEDLNPSHSPVYADLQITSQLRNQR